MVEVVRALDEESGGLAGIGRTTLLTQVFTGGIQRLIRRRAAIGDPAKRQGYLEKVRSNRELLAAWQSRSNLS